MKILKSIRKDVIDLGNYSEGKAPRSATGKSIKMSSNENLIGSSPKAVAAIETALKNGLFAYPDKKQTALKEATARYWRKKGAPVKPGNLLFGDSSGEVLNMLLAAFIEDGDAVVIPENSFILYALLSLPKGAKVKEVKRNDFRIDTGKIAKAVRKTGKTKVVIIANPDNPTSTFLAPEEIEKLMKKIPERTAVIIDEAYIHFAGMENSAIRFLEKYPNLILCYTFSKAYGLASLRVGYAVMNEKLAEQIEKIRLPFNLGSLQQAGAAAALEDEEFLSETLRQIGDGQKYLKGEFKKLGIPCLEPYGNFLFADLGRKCASTVNALEKKGVSVRMLGEFGYKPDFVRITIGKKEDNEFLVRCLEEILN